MMVLHKNSKLTIVHRTEIWDRYCRWDKVKDIARIYRVSRPTVYKVLKQARIRIFQQKNSTNERYRWVYYGLKRLAKIEKKVLEKKNKEARRYNKSYPGEMTHMDTKKLPRVKWITTNEYIFVMIDDYSRELYARITKDKTQISSADALAQFIDECPYKIERLMTDNGKEYKWTKEHEFVKLCEREWIKQVFTRVKRPQTNGKAERVIRTLMEMWHRREEFTSLEQRRKSLNRFVNRYNTVKPHKWIGWNTPYETIEEFYYGEKL